MLRLFQHERRIQALEEGLQKGLEKLDHDLKMLELEWINTLDKLKSMMGRMAKRAAVIEADDGDETAATTPPAPPHDPISKGILARRNKLVRQVTSKIPSGEEK